MLTERPQWLPAKVLADIDFSEYVSKTRKFTMQTKQAKKRGRPRKNPIPVEEETHVLEVLPDPDPCLRTEIVEALAYRACRNPTMLEARLDGERIVVVVSRRFRDRLIGKKIQVRAIYHPNEQPIYEYAP